MYIYTRIRALLWNETRGDMLLSVLFKSSMTTLE